MQLSVEIHSKTDRQNTENPSKICKILFFFQIWGISRFWMGFQYFDDFPSIFEWISAESDNFGATLGDKIIKNKSPDTSNCLETHLEVSVMVCKLRIDR